MTNASRQWQTEHDASRHRNPSDLRNPTQHDPIGRNRYAWRRAVAPGPLRLSAIRRNGIAYFVPGRTPFFLGRRRRTERAPASVLDTSSLLGVSTMLVEKLAASLGVTGLSRSRVSAMAAKLDDLVGRLPEPPGGCPAVHVRVDRCADPEGSRGRPHGERALPDRDRHQRGQVPRDPGHRRDRLRGRAGGWPSCAA
jgi:Transposase, Mutator family